MAVKIEYNHQVLITFWAPKWWLYMFLKLNEKVKGTSWYIIKQTQN